MSIGYIFTMIFGAVVLLGICIFVHELGHLLGGKMVGIKAKVFSMGYGKGVLKKKIGDTTYQITLIPFGGYCQFYGDEPGEERKGESWEYFSAPPLKRIVPVVMGPLFNLFLGIIIFFVMNLAGYERESNRILLADEFAPQGETTYVAPARKAGIRTGDRIVRVNNDAVNQFTEASSSPTAAPSGWESTAPAPRWSTP
jgi:regulator of sigma E protease